MSSPKEVQAVINECLGKLTDLLKQIVVKFEPPEPAKKEGHRINEQVTSWDGGKWVETSYTFVYKPAEQMTTGERIAAARILSLVCDPVACGPSVLYRLTDGTYVGLPVGTGFSSEECARQLRIAVADSIDKAVADEREACAKIVDSFGGQGSVCFDVSKAIRAGREGSARAQV